MCHFVGRDGASQGTMVGHDLLEVRKLGNSTPRRQGSNGTRGHGIDTQTIRWTRRKRTGGCCIHGVLVVVLVGPKLQGHASYQGFQGRLGRSHDMIGIHGSNGAEIGEGRQGGLEGQRQLVLCRRLEGTLSRLQKGIGRDMLGLLKDIPGNVSQRLSQVSMRNAMHNGLNLYSILRGSGRFGCDRLVWETVQHTGYLLREEERQVGLHVAIHMS